MSRAASKSAKGRTPSAPAPPPPPSLSPDVVDIVPGRLTQSNWVSMLGQEEGEEVVVEVLDEFMSQVMERCYEVYLQRQLVPFTASCARDSLMQILEWQFLVQDEGEGPESAPTWAEDSEPLPSTTDSWAQGCVSVIQARPPKHTLPQQTTAVGQAAGRTEKGANQKHHIVGQLSTAPKHSWKDRKLREPPGFRGYKLCPVPPPKDEGGKRRQRSVSSPTNPTQDHMSPRYSLTSSVNDKEEVDDDGDEEVVPHSSTQRVKLLPQRGGGVPATVRLDPARLPRHRVWPQYEVLDDIPTKRRPWRTRGAPVPGQKPDKQHHHTTQKEASLKTLTNYEGPSKAQRRSALSGAVCLSFRRSGVPEGGNTEGILPFSGTLMLDSMELAPGVSLRGPQGTRTSALRGCPVQPERSADLRPIRNDLPMPIFSLEQLAAGLPPRVTPLL